MPRSHSYTPGRSTCPETPMSLVPHDGGPPTLLSHPCRLTHSHPCSTMLGTWQSVSVLLMIVGLPKRPLTAGNGGLIRGQPRLPSSASKSPVSSPQMYAPAPRCTKHSTAHFSPAPVVAP